MKRVKLTYCIEVEVERNLDLETFLCTIEEGATVTKENKALADVFSEDYATLDNMKGRIKTTYPHVKEINFALITVNEIKEI